MRNVTRFACSALIPLVIAMAGCALHKQSDVVSDHCPPPIQNVPAFGDTYLESTDPIHCEATVIDSINPNDIADYQSLKYVPISLEECIERALQTTDVVRDLGVSIARQPARLVTAFDPALTYTNPRFGEEAVLSEFDANLSTRLFFQNNDRPFNNQFTGDVDGRFTQDLLTYDVALTKRAATGTIFSMRNLIDYDANSQVSNRYPSAWQTILESEFRHPLLQGGGVFFNRIAGPSTQEGVYNGILIARINSEISLTRFEQGVRDLISNVENAYWDLYYAYRELEAQTAARDKAYELYQEKVLAGAEGRISTLEVESAKEQYLRFQNNILTSLEGRLVEGTRTDNGSLAGSFRGTIGVRAAERRLRYLLGMPITDGSLLTPADQPTHASVVFDWNESVANAMSRRPERREQLWALKQRQLELTAARNFLMPRLDVVGTYRFRGLGNDFTGGSNTFNDDVNAGTTNSNAWGDLLSGDYQEWQLGGELSVPIGYRRGHSAVRHAELGVARERALLKEQERAITLGLSNSIGELRRAFVSMDLAKQRFEAAMNYAVQAKELEKSRASTIDVVLEAQRRVLESQLEYLRAEVEYMLAIKNVHFERGSLLDYNQVFLNEEESVSAAIHDANLRFGNRGRPINYSLRNPPIAQHGTSSQTVVNVVTPPVEPSVHGSHSTGTRPEKQMTGGHAAPTDASFLPPSGAGNSWTIPAPISTPSWSPTPVPRMSGSSLGELALTPILLSGTVVQEHEYSTPLKSLPLSMPRSTATSK